jgi:hypothetical protein
MGDVQASSIDVLRSKGTANAQNIKGNYKGNSFLVSTQNSGRSDQSHERVGRSSECFRKLTHHSQASPRPAGPRAKEILAPTVQAACFRIDKVLISMRPFVGSSPTRENLIRQNLWCLMSPYTRHATERTRNRCPRHTSDHNETSDVCHSCVACRGRALLQHVANSRSSKL